MAATSVAAIRGAPAAAPTGGGLAHSGGVPAGGLDPTLPPVKSRQVFPGLRSWRRDGEAHPAVRTQGLELRGKKKVFVPGCIYGQEGACCSLLRGQKQS